MPRRKSVNAIRDIGTDFRFDSFVVQKLINMIMERGKKDLACSIVYEAFDVIAEKNGGDDKAYQIFEKAISQIKPSVEVKSRRVGGGVYQIPTEVMPRRALALALRWLIESASDRSDKTMGQRLASEILEASQGRGNSFKKKTDVHRMAEANRAFSHFAW
ncbi:30S ribosomal protein S7 [Candidatus Dependentiae bacterium]|nr:30S ribosomal protein S7 [Candidatus Dependentiae bacterium]MBU4387575.1 30S ribosomal protein S7 [Candidatus Dependentiae bacterium]MCG2755904.1 30S ribosomal protein S7 [Candidatus Dependentiae bacterium]